MPLNYPHYIFIGSGSFYFRLNTNALASNEEAIPLKLFCFWIYYENSTIELLFIFTLLKPFNSIICVFIPFYSNSTFLFLLNYYLYFSGTILSAYDYVITWILRFTVPVWLVIYGNILANQFTFLITIFFNISKEFVWMDI